MRIEDYALIGDCRTAALVATNGSIDWLCVPRFDSNACFAALLGSAKNGRWQIVPADQTDMRVTRRYRPDTMILETRFETATGAATLIDFMPVGGELPQIARIVVGERGQIEFCTELVIRFDYGRLVPWVSRSPDGDLIAVAGPHLLVLRTPAAHRGEDFRTVSAFTVSAGERVPFMLSYGPSHLPVPSPTQPEAALHDAEAYWTQWAARCNYRGAHRDAVVRSLLTLKALTYAPTGGIVAAPTTSLPEQIGGPRNWDYRFCWLRDATFTLLALLQAGYSDEAESWRRWLVRAVAGHPTQLQPLYGLAGEHRLDEWEVPWLAGFGKSLPVRIGNAAAAQVQHDVFGEVMDALHHARRTGLSRWRDSWVLQRVLVEHLETIFEEPDRGIWEVRGDAQHFTHSKVMAWVAFDRAVSAVEEFGIDAPAERWRRLRAKLHAEICARAFDPELGAFVQAYGSKQLDASTLLIPIVGFLPPDDPRVVGTVEAIRTRLTVDGFVLRYNTGRTDDGLPPGEGVFLACSFWLIDNLVLQGRRAEANALFTQLLAVRNDVGLLAEEYDPRARVQLGNFPQALSHLALVDTAYNLREPEGPAKERAKHAPAM